jgi:hypothetical protein
MVCLITGMVFFLGHGWEVVAQNAPEKTPVETNESANDPDSSNPTPEDIPLTPEDTPPTPEDAPLTPEKETKWFLSGYKLGLAVTATSVLFEYDPNLTDDELAKDDNYAQYEDPNTGTRTAYINYKGKNVFGSTGVLDEPVLSWKISLSGKENYLGQSGFGYQMVFETFSVKSEVESYLPYGSKTRVRLERGTQAEALGIVVNPLFFYTIGDPNHWFYGKAGAGIGLGYLDGKVDAVIVEKYSCHNNPNRSYDFIQEDVDNYQYCSTTAENTRHIEQKGFTLGYSVFLQAQLYHLFGVFEYNITYLNSDGKARFSTEKGVPYMGMTMTRLTVGYQLDL